MGWVELGGWMGLGGVGGGIQFYINRFTIYFG